MAHSDFSNLPPDYWESLALTNTSSRNRSSIPSTTNPDYDPNSPAALGFRNVSQIQSLGREQTTLLESLFTQTTSRSEDAAQALDTQIASLGTTLNTLLEDIQLRSDQARSDTAVATASGITSQEAARNALLGNANILENTAPARAVFSSDTSRPLGAVGSSRDKSITVSRTLGNGSGL